MLVGRANEVLILARTRREAKFCLLNWSRDLRQILERAFAKEPTLSIVDGCVLRLSEARAENESEKEKRSKRSLDESEASIKRLQPLALWKDLAVAPTKSEGAKEQFGSSLGSGIGEKSEKTDSRKSPAELADVRLHSPLVSSADPRKRPIKQNETEKLTDET